MNIDKQVQFYAETLKLNKIEAHPIASQYYIFHNVYSVFVRCLCAFSAIQSSICSGDTYDSMRNSHILLQFQHMPERFIVSAVLLSGICSCYSCIWHIAQFNNVSGICFILRMYLSLGLSLLSIQLRIILCVMRICIYRWSFLFYRYSFSLANARERISSNRWGISMGHMLFLFPILRVQIELSALFVTGVCNTRLWASYLTRIIRETQSLSY